MLFMKRNYMILPAAFIVAVVLLISATLREKHPYGFENGTADIQSISALAFGPDGILFIGDSRNASIIAIDTKDKAKDEKGQAIEMKNVEQKLAALLGTEARNITHGGYAARKPAEVLHSVFETHVGNRSPFFCVLAAQRCGYCRGCLP